MSDKPEVQKTEAESCSPREEKIRARWRGVRAARVASIGLEMGICVAIGYFIGHYLGERFDVEPWGTVNGTLLGCLAGASALYRIYKQNQKEQDDDVANKKIAKSAENKE